MSPTLRAVIVGLVVGTVLYVMLDSGMVNAEPAPWFFSVSLGGLGTLFGLGAWATSAAGQHQRSPMLAGLSMGVIGYAIVRLMLFGTG